MGRVQQRFCVRVPGILQDLFAAALFHHASVFQNQDPSLSVAHHIKIVGDKEQRAAPLPQMKKLFHCLAPVNGVQSGGGFIGDDEPGVSRNGKSCLLYTSRCV